MEDHDLRDLVGDELSADELQSLGEADELLRAAEPLPEAPKELGVSVRGIPHTEEQVNDKHSRQRSVLQHRPAVLAIATALAGIAFAIGWFSRGGDGASGSPAEIVTLQATRFASNEATMLIDVFPQDEGGNRVLLADVNGLNPIGAEQHYELWLTRNNRVAASCGRFLVDENGTAHGVWFNAPYDFADFDDWVVTAEGPGNQRSRVLLRAPVTTVAS